MQQRYIAIVKDNNFKQITFERFACKKAETAKRQMQGLFANSLYRACTRSGMFNTFLIRRLS